MDVVWLRLQKFKISFGIYFQIQVYASMYGGGGDSKSWFNIYYHLSNLLSEANIMLIQTLCQKVGGEFLSQQSMDLMRKAVAGKNVQVFYLCLDYAFSKP